jgi:DNA-binding transcriptional regulator GbsR (MarR family)
MIRYNRCLHKLLGNEDAWWILATLAATERPMTYKDLEKKTQLSQSVIGKHVRVMVDFGIVKKEGHPTRLFTLTDRAATKRFIQSWRDFREAIRRANDGQVVNKPRSLHRKELRLIVDNTKQG